MDKNIDLKSSNIRTDLIMESIETNNITTKIKEKNIEDITIKNFGLIKSTSAFI